jgi:hypothetical protein
VFWLVGQHVWLGAHSQGFSLHGGGVELELLLEQASAREAMVDRKNGANRFMTTAQGSTRTNVNPSMNWIFS